jgi:Ca2+-binding EF-hand superfamily protein
MENKFKTTTKNAKSYDNKDIQKHFKRDSMGVPSSFVTEEVTKAKTKVTTSEYLKKANQHVVEFFKKELLNEIIEKSIYIGEFYAIHKGNQELYENRKVQKEINFITNDYNNTLSYNNDSVLYFFASNIFDKLFIIDCQARMTFNNLNEPNNKITSFSLFNIFEKNYLALDVYNNEDSLTYTNEFFILLNNLELTMFDYIKYTKAEATLTHWEKLSLSKKHFNFKSYLPVIHNKDYVNKSFLENKFKFIQKGSSNLIIFNFTHIADRVIIFNKDTFNVSYNLYINPMQFYKLINTTFQNSLVYLLQTMINKRWSLEDIQNFNRIMERMRKEKKSLFNIKLLISILNNENVEKEKIEINENYDLSRVNKPKYTHNELLYQAIVNLIVNTFDCDFDFFIFMYDFQKFLNKIANLSLITETGCINYFSNIEQFISDKKIFDQSGNLIPEKPSENPKQINLKLLILIKVVSRNFDLRKIIDAYDKDRLFYITKNEFLRILKSLPIGITDEEAEQFLDFLPKDEYGHILYEIFFQSDDFLINELILKNKNHKYNKSKAYGYLTKMKNTDLDDFYKCISLTYKANDVKDYTDINECIATKVEKVTIEKSYLSLLNINTTVKSLAFVPNLNIFFMISDEKKTSKIAIIKYNHIYNNKSRVLTTTSLLGFIDTMSLVNPRLLNYIPDRNLLVTQSIKKESVDLMLFDVYKDIVDLYQSNDLWTIKKGITIKSVSDKPIEQFNYLPGNKLFFFKAGNDIKIINPKSKQHDLAIKYYQDRQAESVYDRVSKKICERPSEMTGDMNFKIIKHLKLSGANSNIAFTNYSVNNTQTPYNMHLKLDFLIIIENVSLKSIGITSLYCSNNAVSLDNIIPEFEQLNILAQKQKKKILTDFKENLKKTINANDTKTKEQNALYEKVKLITKDVIINAKIISEKDIKETISKLTSYNDSTAIFKKLNLLHNSSHISKLTSEDRVTPLFKTLSKPNDKESFVLNLLYTSGFDILSLFRRVKNYKIEYSPIDKTSFLNIINTKFTALLKDFNDANLQLITETLQNSVTFDYFFKLISSTPLLYNPKSTKFNPQITKNILESLNLLSDNKNFQHEQENETNETPYNSAVKKFAICFVNNKVPFDISFKLFDEYEDEIIDVKQFSQGFKKLNANISKIEIEAIFRAIDLNNSDCITEEEYKKFLEKNIRNLYNTYLTGIPSDLVLTTKKLDELLDPENIKFNEEFLYLTFMKFFDYLETNGVRLDISFKLFDTYNYGFIFPGQFLRVTTIGNTILKENELVTMFKYIDIHKKGYIYENDYYSVMQHYLLNPGPNRKKYLRMIREEGLVSKRDPLGNFRNKIDNYKLTQDDIINITFFLLKRLNEYILSSDLKEDAKKEKGLFTKLSNGEDYLQMSEFKNILKNLITSLKNYEVELFCDSYIDPKGFGIILYADFYDKIESVIKYLNLIMSKSNVLLEDEPSLHTFRPLQRGSTINIKSSNSINDEQKDIRYIYHTLKTVQDTLRTTALKVDQIFFVLDSGKHGFLTLGSLMKNLPLKFHINLNINQHLAFFNYLDKSKNGYILFEQFKSFFDVPFSTMIFENEEYECYTLLDKIQERTLLLLNKEHADIRNIYDTIINIEHLNDGNANLNSLTFKKGYLDTDEIVSFFKNLLGLKISLHDMKLIFDLFFSDKKVQGISLRKFIILLEILGVNINLYTDLGNVNELVDEFLIQLLNSFSNKFFTQLKEINTNDIPLGLIYKCLDDYDTNKDSFLDAKEFTVFFKALGITNPSTINNLIIRFSDHDNNNQISLTNFALMLRYLFKVYTTPRKIITNFSKTDSNSILQYLQNNLPVISELVKISSEINKYSKDYQEMIHQGIFSGLIIFSKFFENNNFTNTICLARRSLYDYFTIFSKKANDLIVQNFKLRLHPVEKISIKIDYTKVDIPHIQLHILNKNLCENVEEIYYKSNYLGEHFNIYHDGLQKYVKVTRFIKSAIRELISKDNQSLLGHIEYSIKLNHFLQQNPENKNCKYFLTNRLFLQYR